MAILETLAAAGAGLKQLGSLAKTLNNVEVQRQLVDVHEKVLEAHGQILALMDENRALKDELAKLRTTLDIRQRVKPRNGSYYLDDDGPFCMRCWDVDVKLVRLTEGYQGVHYCAQCALLSTSGRKR